MIAASTNVIEVTPDPAATTAELTLLADGVPVAALPAATHAEGTWRVDVPHTATPPLFADLTASWLLGRSVGDTVQYRTVTAHDEVTAHGIWRPARIAEARAHLRITDRGHDALLDGLLSDALADIEAHVGRSLRSVEHTEIAYAEGGTLRLTHWPVASVSEVTHASGHVVTGHGTRRPFGHVTGLADGEFEVTYTGGLEASPDWPRIAADLRAACLDIVATRFAAPVPVSADRDGDVATTYDLSMSRILARLDRYRSVVA